MTNATFFKSIVYTAFAVSAVWAFSLTFAGSASAGNPLLCKGPTKNSVMACCQKEIVAHRPAWMKFGSLSCSEVIACGGRQGNKLRCFVEQPSITNLTHAPDSSQSIKISDVRLKTNIHRVGTTVLNLPLYSFEYSKKIGSYIGVMAQDVLKVEPSAVSVGRDGFYRVDYSKLGIEMLQVK